MINRELSDLKDINWGEFKIGEIFSIKRSKVHDKINLKETHRGIPHISRTNLNNGLNCIVFNDNFQENPKNTIVFGAENANFFFQPFNYITGDKMYVISHEKFNRYNSLFIKLMLEYSIKNSGFGYGKGLTGTRLKIRTILLPITKNGLPNWDFMESFVKAEEKSQLIKYKNYLKNNFDYLKKYESPLEEGLSSKTWKEFEIGDLFNVKGSKTTPLSELKNKNNTEELYPYITTKSLNNGIDGFFRYYSELGNVITIDSATIGHVSYQKNNFSASDHVEILEPKFEMNKYLALFFVQAITSACNKKYNYGYKFSQRRIIRQKILLPVDGNGNQDLEFMESYMKNMEHEKICDYLDYIENKLPNFQK